MGDLTLVSSGHRRPKKAEYRQRAHCNPLADSFLTYPPSPDFVDWSRHFPKIFGVSPPPPMCLNTSDYPIQYEEPVVAELNGSSGRAPDFLDVGCGFGGLLVSLAPKFPEALIMGLEIREKVTNFVGERIRALRQEHQSDGLYENVSVIRTNATKFLLNYFRKAQVATALVNAPAAAAAAAAAACAATARASAAAAAAATARASAAAAAAGVCAATARASAAAVPATAAGAVSAAAAAAANRAAAAGVGAQVSKMFFCFPDPHFKRTNWRRRIINAPLLTLYAYIMKPGGRLYTATDVEEVHQWMLHALRRHPLFTELTEEEMKEDPCVAIIQSDTEESMKARREGRRAFTCVFTRL
ncbi:hypothetical protein Efla_003635 [Eimeria flavescens]